MCPERRNRGYTLVEVLVAFLILALALTVLLRIFSGGLRSVSVSSDYAEAVMIAESQLTLAGLDERLVAGETSGVEGAHFEWTRQVAEYRSSPDYEAATRHANGFHVAVTVSWPNGERRRSIELHTVKLANSEGRVR
jgi:general secretion pathway protein I